MRHIVRFPGRRERDAHFDRRRRTITLTCCARSTFDVPTPKGAFYVYPLRRAPAGSRDRGRVARRASFAIHPRRGRVAADRARPSALGCAFALADDDLVEASPACRALRLMRRSNGRAGAPSVGPPSPTGTQNTAGATPTCMCAHPRQLRRRLLRPRGPRTSGVPAPRVDVGASETRARRTPARRTCSCSGTHWAGSSLLPRPSLDPTRLRGLVLTLRRCLLPTSPLPMPHAASREGCADLVVAKGASDIVSPCRATRVSATSARPAHLQGRRADPDEA